MGIHGHLIISSTATRGHLADNACGTELENIVIPERDTYEDIDDVLRSFIDLAAQHKRTYTRMERHGSIARS
jgi:hypothetical protein